MYRLRARQRSTRTNAKAASFEFWNARATRLWARFSTRGIFITSCPDDPRLVHNVYVQVPPREKLPKAPALGDKVVVRLEAWESRHVNPEGEIIEVLGPATAPGVDMLSIIRKYDLPTEFPREVVDEANRIPETVKRPNARRPRRFARKIHCHHRPG